MSDFPRQVQIVEHAVVGVAALYAAISVYRHLKKVGLMGIVNAIPGAKGMLDNQLEKEVNSAVATLFPKTPEGVDDFVTFPEDPQSPETLKKMLDILQTYDASGKTGKSFAYIYDCGDVFPHHNENVEHAFCQFMHENALNPTAFPSLRRFEVEVVQMTLDMLHAPPGAVGTMSSGGTESILCAIKTYRDWSREKKPHITEPEIILPITAHPAFVKACEYFCLTPLFVEVNQKPWKADIDKIRAAITKNTILLVVSAPQYPHGVVDPVEEAAALALEKDLPLHVDACIGGFMLPWVEMLGRNVPLWDFRVKGVTSISADIHKYGFCPKGSSVIAYINDELRKFQFTSYSGWPGGLYVSPGVLGSRNGGAIASAWFSLISLGRKGFIDAAKLTMEAADIMRTGIESIEGLEMMGEPHMSILSFRTTDGTDVYVVADIMKEKYGWNLERQQLPASLHMTLMPSHRKVAEDFVENLKEAVPEARAHPELSQQGTAATYGAVAKIPSTAVLDSFLKVFMSKVYQP